MDRQDTLAAAIGRRALIAGGGAMALTPGLAAAPRRGARIDLLLKGGTIVDGSGRARFTGDVAVSGERIVHVGAPWPAGDARRTIDARGLIVAPGFIEPHAHITAIDGDPIPENFLRQGIATIINSLHSLDQPYPLGAFLDRLRVAPNTVWTAGHSWVRKRVLGMADRAPTQAELARMERLVGEAMDDGAVGLATGLEYIPANYAKTDEIIALSRASRRPHSVYVTHLRDEGSALIPAVAEALEIGRAAGLPVHINHIKSTGAANWGASTKVIGMIDRANRAGGRVSFDLYPYTAYSTVSTVLFPSWVLAGGTEAYRRRIADPATLARLRREMAVIYPAQTGGTIDSIQFREITGVAGFAGKSLRDYLIANGRPLTIAAGIDAIIALQAGGGFIAIFHAMSDRDIDAFLLHPLASITTDGDLVRLGEGFPHPRSYGAFPRVLARYVRERHLLSLETAVMKMTGLVARDFALAGRGLVREGGFADLVLFDADRIVDRATYTDPHHYSEGVVHLIVGGQPVLDDGRVTGRLPGTPIRRLGWRRG